MAKRHVEHILNDSLPCTETSRCIRWLDSSFKLYTELQLIIREIQLLNFITSFIDFN